MLNSFVHLSLFPVSEEPGTPPTATGLSPHLVQAHHPRTRSKSKSNNPSPSQFHLLLLPLLFKRPLLFSPSLLFKQRKSLASPFDLHACNLFSYITVEICFASFCPPFWGTRLILKKRKPFIILGRIISYLDKSRNRNFCKCPLITVSSSVVEF